MGFADSGTAFTITNPADIAAAIGADPSGQSARLVDNKPVAYTVTANLTNLGAGAVPVLVQADMSNALAVTVNLSQILAPRGSTALATAPNSGPNVGFDLQFDWLDSTGNVVLFSETYEINCFVDPPVGQAIITEWSATIPCRGSLLNVTAVNPLATLWATGVGGGFVMKLNTSSRVVPASIRGYGDGVALDGVLLTQTGSVPANSQTIVVASPSVARQFVNFQAASVQVRLDVALGLARVGPLLWRNVTTWPATATASSVSQEFPATNRPLSVLIANLSATTAAGYNLAVIGARN
jgi:hypothetical protein